MTARELIEHALYTLWEHDIEILPDDIIIAGYVIFSVRLLDGAKYIDVEYDEKGAKFLHPDKFYMPLIITEPSEAMSLVGETFEPKPFEEFPFVNNKEIVRKAIDVISGESDLDMESLNSQDRSFRIFIIGNCNWLSINTGITEGCSIPGYTFNNREMFPKIMEEKKDYKTLFHNLCLIIHRFYDDLTPLFYRKIGEKIY